MTRFLLLLALFLTPPVYADAFSEMVGIYESTSGLEVRILKGNAVDRHRLEIWSGRDLLGTTSLIRESSTEKEARVRYTWRRAEISGVYYPIGERAYLENKAQDWCVVWGKRQTR